MKSLAGKLLEDYKKIQEDNSIMKNPVVMKDNKDMIINFTVVYLFVPDDSDGIHDEGMQQGFVSPDGKRVPYNDNNIDAQEKKFIRSYPVNKFIDFLNSQDIERSEMASNENEYPYFELAPKDGRTGTFYYNIEVVGATENGKKISSNKVVEKISDDLGVDCYGVWE